MITKKKCWLVSFFTVLVLVFTCFLLGSVGQTIGTIILIRCMEALWWDLLNMIRGLFAFWFCRGWGMMKSVIGNGAPLGTSHWLREIISRVVYVSNRVRVMWFNWYSLGQCELFQIAPFPATYEHTYFPLDSQVVVSNYKQIQISDIFKIYSHFRKVLEQIKCNFHYTTEEILLLKQIVCN